MKEPKEPIVKSFFEKLKMNTKLLLKKTKSIFVLDPEEYVNKMSQNNYYPYGKSIDKIASAIKKSKKVSPRDKIGLMLDAYGKYFKYQFSRQVVNDVYETAYEEFTYTVQGQDYKNHAVYAKLREYRESELQYITIRQFKADIEAVIENYVEDCEKNGKEVRLPYDLKMFTDLTKDLKDDYWDKYDSKKGLYILSDDEQAIRRKLVGRIDYKLEAAAQAEREAKIEAMRTQNGSPSTFVNTLHNDDDMQQ